MEERRKTKIEGEKGREKKRKKKGKKKGVVVFLAFSHLCFSFILVDKVEE